jgi:mRNA interferase MazF
VVVQHDRYNRSAIGTTIVAAITSNLRLSAMAGNVRLAKGEAGLPRASVVNISQVATIDTAQLTERIGVLSARKRAEVIDAMALILGPELAHH